MNPATLPPRNRWSKRHDRQQVAPAFVAAPVGKTDPGSGSVYRLSHPQRAGSTTIWTEKTSVSR